MPGSSIAPLGIIAGAGEIAPLLAKEAKAIGATVVAVTFDQATNEIMSQVADKTFLLGLAQAGKIIDTLKKEGVREVSFIGKVDKRVLLKNPKFDLRAISILKRLNARNDDSIMLAIVGELEKEGFIIADQTKLLKNLLPGEGVFSKRKPSAKEWEDIKFGMKMAKGIAGLDIGQTVVVKDSAVMAVEAIEGTDETVERGGAIGGKGAIVCKVCKPNQDPRFDVPAVGTSTIEVMKKSNCSLLAIEAHSTLVVGMDKVSAACDSSDIAFVSVGIS